MSAGPAGGAGISGADVSRLVEAWEQRARCHFKSAEKYPVGSFGRRFIEYGAMGLFNCAQELRTAAGLEPLSHELPATPAETTIASATGAAS